MKPSLAFISGAGSGLGRALACLLAKEKIPLFLTSKEKEKLILLKEELEKFTSVTIFPANLALPKDLQALLEELRKTPPDLIINNAGLGLYGSILSCALERQMEIVKVNINALVEISIETARLLQEEKRKGTIMNISSAASYFTYPYFSLYAASKRFVRDFSISFNAEVAPLGIRVLTCLPGRFSTTFRQKAYQNKSLVPVSKWDTMSLEKTAKRILRQIETQKTCQTIDLRYRILCNLMKLIPNCLLMKILKKTIKF